MRPKPLYRTRLDEAESENRSTEIKKIELRKQVVENAFSQAATFLKALLTFNGAGAGLVITLLGNVAANKKTVQIDIHELINSLLFYSLGAWLALTCLLLSFVAAAMHAEGEYTWNEGYDRSRFIRVVALAFAVISLLCFLLASANAVRSFQ